MPPLYLPRTVAGYLHTVLNPSILMGVTCRKQGKSIRAQPTS